MLGLAPVLQPRQRANGDERHYHYGKSMRNYSPDSTDDDCERSWSVRQFGQIPVSNVPLYFAPPRGRQCQQTLGNPSRAGRKAGPVVLITREAVSVIDLDEYIAAREIGGPAWPPTLRLVP